MARVRFLDQVPVGFYDTNNGGGGTGAGFPYSGSAIITGSLLISGSGLTVTGSINADNITGSLFGTASWAINALTASNTISSSFASTASYLNPGTYSITSSWAISASNAVSSSFAQNAYSSQNTQDVIINVLNQSGNNIAKGVVVRITGSNNSSDIPRIVTASYINDNNSANTLGITNQPIAQGATGSVITEGILSGIDTNNFISGQLIYLGATGSIIGYAPQAPLHAVRLGEVIRSQQNNGSIYVRIDNGYELDELHNVLITSPSSSGDLLMLSGSVWTNSKILTGSYTLSGSLTTNDGVQVQSLTASFISASQITGSLFGTASWAQNSLNADFAATAGEADSAQTASFLPVGTYAITASWAQSASNAITSQTASFISTTSTNAFVQGGNSFGVATAMLGNNDNNNLAIETNGSTRIFIDKGGNIGIGSGNAASTQTLYIQGSSAVSEDVFAVANSTPTTLFTIQNRGNVGIGTTNPGAKLSITGSNTDTLFQVASPTNNAILFVSGSSRVGMRIANPLYDFHIAGVNSTATATVAIGIAQTSSGILRIERSGAANNTGIVIQGTNGTVLGAGGAPVWEPYGYTTADHNFNIGSSTLGSFNWYFGTNATLNNNTRLMQLSRQGNLGIGVFDLALTGSNPRFYVSGSTSQPLLIASSSAGTALFVSGSGNVGINTANPGTTLDVSGSIRSTTSIISGSQNTTLLTINGYDLTGSNAQSAIDITGSWNTIGTPALIRANVSNISSNALSSLIRLQANSLDLLTLSATGIIRLGSNSQPVWISPVANNGFATSDSTGNGLGFNIRSNTPSTGFITIAGISSTVTSSGVDVFAIGLGVSPSSGNAIVNQVSIRPAISQSFTANGINRGIMIQPNLISAFDWRSIEWNNNTGYGLYGAGGATNYLNGNLSIGTFNSQSRFHILGSISQPLLIASSSAGTALFVSGSGNVGIGTNTPQATLHISGAISGSILEPTSSGVPTFTGRNGQFIFGTNAGNHFIYVWMAGAWRSSSLF